MLQEAWSTLSSAMQQILVEALLADGISKDANIFSFLPLYLEKAKQNLAVGLGPALEVLVSLMELFKKEHPEVFTSLRVVEVNLSDLAAFAGRVKCPRVFKEVPQQTVFVRGQGEDSIRHLVRTDLWNQVHHAYNHREYDLQEMAHVLTKVEREAVAIRRLVEKTTKPELTHEVVQGAQIAKVDAVVTVTPSAEHLRTSSQLTQSVSCAGPRTPPHTPALTPRVA